MLPEGRCARAEQRRLRQQPADCRREDETQRRRQRTSRRSAQQHPGLGRQLHAQQSRSDDDGPANAEQPQHAAAVSLNSLNLFSLLI